MKPLIGCLIVALSPAIALAEDAVAAVLAAEAARGEALRRNDAPALARLLSDDLRYIHSTGRVERKADTVGSLAEGKSAYQRFDVSALQSQQVAPGVVVLTGRIDQRKLVRGSWADAILLFHAVWRNESGTWRLVSLQTVAPAVPKP